MYDYRTEIPKDGWGTWDRDLDAISEAFDRCLGTFDVKHARRPPLNVETLEVKDLDGGLVCEKIHYQVEPGEYVPAYLLRPEKPTGPMAAIIAFHGHGGNYEAGKEGLIAPDQRGLSLGLDFALQFARAGYAVLCPDSVCFGQRRNPYADRWPDWFWERIVSMREIAEGGCMARKNVWDNMRAVDVLQGLDYIDPERIGGCGLSMGSGMTFYTMMREPRLKVGVAVCSMYTTEALYGQPLMHCMMNWIPRMISERLEMHDVFPLIAPRPLMLINPTASFEDPLPATRELYEKSRWAWEDAHSGEAFALEVFEGKHEFPPPMQRKAIDWFGRWL